MFKGGKIPPDYEKCLDIERQMLKCENIKLKERINKAIKCLEREEISRESIIDILRGRNRC